MSLSIQNGPNTASFQDVGRFRKFFFLLSPGWVILFLFFLAGCEKKEPVSSPEGPAQQISYNTDWPMYGFDPSLRGYVDVSIASELDLVWTFTTEGPVSAGPVIADGTVYIGSRDKIFYAIDLAGGQEQWRFAAEDAVEGTAFITGETVCFGAADSHVYALNRTDGTLKWKFKTGAKVMGAINGYTDPSGKTYILFGSYDSGVYSIHAETGEPSWSYEAGSYINGAPAVYQDTVIFGSCDAKIHVVSAQTGEKIREIDTGAYIPGSCAVDGGCIYGGNYDGVFLKTDIASGQVLWKFEQAGDAFMASPGIKGNFAAAGSQDKTLYCLNAETGVKLWSFEAKDAVNSAVIICRDKVLFGSDDGRLYMLDLATGHKIWSFLAGRPIASSPAYAQGRLVVGCDDGSIYAFAAKEKAK